jgi:hypothetical protein
MKSGMTIEQLRGMLDLQKEWDANEARKAYVADMAEFKKNPPEIFKTKLVEFPSRDSNKPATSYRHATLGNVTALTVAALAAHGFSHRWDTQQQDGGQIFVTCTLTHRLGHKESTSLHSSPDQTGNKNNIQAMGSTISYLQRYTLLAACGLATMDEPDDDGELGGRKDGRYDAEGTLREWTDKANAAINPLALAETRKMANAEFQVAKDLAGWEAFKVVANAKRAQLEKDGAK